MKGHSVFPFVLLISAPLAAQPVPLPGPERADLRSATAPAAGIRGQPVVAADRGGNFLVVWAVRDAAFRDAAFRDAAFRDDGVSKVTAQRFRADGQPAGGELRIAGDLAAGGAPAAAVDRDSSFTVVWPTAGGTLDGRRFDHRGEPLTGVFRVAGRSGDPLDGPRRPSLAATAGGELVAVWEAGKGSAVFGQRIAADGRPLGPRFRVGQGDARPGRPVVRASDGGRFVVVWQAGDGSGLGVFGRRFDRRTQALGDEFQINVHTSDDQRNPALAVAADGSFAVVWQSAFQDGERWSLRGRRFGGRVLRGSRELPIGGDAGGVRRRPALALAADGSALVAWEDFARDPRGDVRARWMDRDGRPLGADFRIGAAAGAGLQPSLAATGPGSFAAVWTAGAGSEPPGIGLRRYGSPRLELVDHRFVAEVTWKDFTLRAGRGVAVPHRANTGHFWFFREEDLDLTLKVVDGRAVNGHFWVFYGAVSNVAFTLRITDRETGRVKTYLGPVGRFASGGDVHAFPSP